MDLELFGWNAVLAEHFASLHRGDPSLVAARVVCGYREQYHVWSEIGELTARVSGRMMHAAASRADYPAVGDWVALQPRPNEGVGTIHAVLPRRSAFMRQASSGTTEAQVVAANVDTLFLVSAMDQDLNPRRIERYLTLVWECGADPVIVLNKADACPDAAGPVKDVEAIAAGVPVYAVSAVTGAGLDELQRYLLPGVTVALLGSSGVGKSTLINRLLGEERLKTGAVRDDDHRGRHTTTHRELLLIPCGALMIDTPGMRALQLWNETGSLEDTFGDVEALVTMCRFADCRHGAEPGCAVQAALADGTPDRERYQSYRKLERELRYLETRQDQRAAMEEKNRGKRLSRRVKDLQKSPKHR
ncbi:MAG: ribosome small subunit-dependent GTPase A [Anaerolineae bacterium]